MKILMVLTSHDVLGNTGRKTGFWLEEFAAPYFVFRDAGVPLTLASPKGEERFTKKSNARHDAVQAVGNHPSIAAQNLMNLLAAEKAA
jgi:putative intracellular protease/amidase